MKNAKEGLQHSKESATRSLKEGKWNEDKPFTKEDIDYFKKIKENGDDMYLEMIKRLSCENPKLIDNYPHETPYINEDKLED